MNFQDCWQAVAMQAGVPDPMLCRLWTQWAYNQFCDRRKWSNLRAEMAIVCNDQKTGNCTVTKGSTTVAGGTLTFAATDVGRQFRLGSIPIYTIVAVDVAGGTTATLERTYTEASGLTVAYILDAYVTMPEDFHTFYSVLDPANRWRLRWWVNSETLDRWDPGRTSPGNARLLANHSYSPVAGMAGRARYELYPYQTSAKAYPVWYYRKPENLLDAQEIVGPLARRASEILSLGALSSCALWPGTATIKNPYFSPSLSRELRDQFEVRLTEIVVVDDELFFEGIQLTQFGWADFPWDAAWLQSHEPYTIG